MGENHKPIQVRKSTYQMIKERAEKNDRSMSAELDRALRATPEQKADFLLKNVRAKAIELIKELDRAKPDGVNLIPFDGDIRQMTKWLYMAAELSEDFTEDLDDK